MLAARVDRDSEPLLPDRFASLAARFRCGAEAVSVAIVALEQATGTRRDVVHFADAEATVSPHCDPAYVLTSSFQSCWD
jgi:hypothetical protein